MANLKPLMEMCLTFKQDAIFSLKGGHFSLIFIAAKRTRKARAICQYKTQKSPMTIVIAFECVSNTDFITPLYFLNVNTKFFYFVYLSYH